MPKESSNDEIVRRHAELRNTLIRKASKIAAETIMKLKNPDAKTVAQIIEESFKREN